MFGFWLAWVITDGLREAGQAGKRKDKAGRTVKPLCLITSWFKTTPSACFLVVARSLGPGLIAHPRIRLELVWVRNSTV